MPMFLKIAVDRAAIHASTQKALLIDLPKGWRFWHARKLAYQHPDDPSLFLVGCYDSTPGALCFLQEGRTKTDERVVPWASIARVSRGFYTQPTGYLAPLAVEVGMAAAFRSRRKLGRHTPETLEPLTGVQAHESLIR